MRNLLAMVALLLCGAASAWAAESVVDPECYECQEWCAAGQPVIRQVEDGFYLNGRDDLGVTWEEVVSPDGETLTYKGIVYRLCPTAAAAKSQSWCNNEGEPKQVITQTDSTKSVFVLDGKTLVEGEVDITHTEKYDDTDEIILVYRNRIFWPCEVK